MEKNNICLLEKVIFQKNIKIAKLLEKIGKKLPTLKKWQKELIALKLNKLIKNKNLFYETKTHIFFMIKRLIEIGGKNGK